MAVLWTDAICVTPPDLTRVDSEAIAVARAEKITLGGENSTCQAGVEDAAAELMKLVISFGGYLNSGDLTANHLAAVLNVGIGNSVRQKVGLQQVVVSGDVPTQWSWVKRWAVYYVLRALYRDAFSRTTADRYKLKLDFFKDEQIRRITPQLLTLGVPIVTQPLSRPAAFYEVNSGTWDPSNVTTVAGAGTLDNTTLDVAITYVNMSQFNFYRSQELRNNMESEPSDVVTLPILADNVVSVDTSTLNPPTGRQSPSQTLVVVVSPSAATHWNLWVGRTGGPLFLQNIEPIPISTKVTTLTGDPVLSGYRMQQGQYADRRLSIVLTRQRA